MRRIEPLNDKLMVPSIPIGFIDDVIQAGRCRGMDVESVLQNNGLSMATVTAAGIRISVNTYSQILRQLVELTNDAFFSFLSSPIPIKSLHVFCYGLVGCRNLEECIDYANDYYSLFTNDFHWKLERDGKDIVLAVQIKEVFPVDYRFVIQSLLLIPLRLFGWLLGEDIQAKAVNFSFSKNATDDSLSYLYGKNIFYDSEINSIHLDAAYTSARLSCTRDQITQMLKKTSYLFLVSRRSNPLTKEVRRLLLSNKGKIWLEVEEVAELLNMNANTLWRKLKKENSSFIDIRNQIKRDWALVLLEDPSNTIENVADQLHYCDVSAFRKAFKKWTGLQPAQYRNMLGLSEQLLR